MFTTSCEHALECPRACKMVFPPLLRFPSFSLHLVLAHWLFLICTCNAQRGACAPCARRLVHDLARARSVSRCRCCRRPESSLSVRKSGVLASCGGGPREFGPEGVALSQFFIRFLNSSPQKAMNGSCDECLCKVQGVGCRVCDDTSCLCHRPWSTRFRW